MKIQRLIVFAMLIMVLIFFKDRIQREPTENLLIEPGIGFDIKQTEQEKIQYVLAIPAYTFTENKVSTDIFIASSLSIPDTRQDRQRKINKRFIAGFEKVYVFSEKYARFGISNSMDILFRNPWVNDDGYTIVCKGPAEDVIRLKVEGYPSSSDFLDGLIYSIRTNNFFCKRYTLINVFKSMDSEGVNMVMPYIVINNEKIEITGMAIFKGDKMINLLDMDDTRVMNMLRENKVKGILNIQKNSKKCVSYEASLERDVKCYKDKEKYRFLINLVFNGDIISDELYNLTLDDPEENKKLEEEFAIKIRSICIDFIKKMQDEYKMDMLNLGSVAASKYGRHTGTNWDNEISRADIDVNVKVKISGFGRGYFHIGQKE